MRKQSEKDAVLQIRLPASLKTAFLRVCQEEDQSAAQILRRFIRVYVDNHRQLDFETLLLKDRQR